MQCKIMIKNIFKENISWFSLVDVWQTGVTETDFWTRNTKKNYVISPTKGVHVSLVPGVPSEMPVP